MVTLNLFDSNFPHQACSVALQTPKTMRYVRSRLSWDGITVFTDRWMFNPLVDDVQSRYKIGWLHEGRCLHPENYARIGEVAHKFDAIMTHDARLLASGAPFVQTIRGGSWVQLGQWGMYPKTKNVSMILSEKTQLEGHRLRHAIADAGLPIDVYGPQPFLGGNKALAYKDYRYAVVVEACKEENFFSEHLIDALAYGCQVFYWGCLNIAEYLSIGVIGGAITPFRDLPYLAQQLYAIRPRVHDDTIRTTQAEARAYAITEDWQVAHCLRPFVEAL